MLSIKHKKIISNLVSKMIYIKTYHNGQYRFKILNLKNQFLINFDILYKKFYYIFGF